MSRRGQVETFDVLRGKVIKNYFDLLLIDVLFLTLWSTACAWNQWSKWRSTGAAFWGQGLFVVTQIVLRVSVCVSICLRLPTVWQSHGGVKEVSVCVCVCVLYFNSEPVRYLRCKVSLIVHAQHQLQNIDQINAVCFSQTVHTQKDRYFSPPLTS